MSAAPAMRVEDVAGHALAVGNFDGADCVTAASLGKAINVAIRKAAAIDPRIDTDRAPQWPFDFGLSGVAVIGGKPAGTWDLSERYSEIVVMGQTVTDLDSDTAATGRAEDPGVARYRPLVIVPEKGVDRAGARDLARWEAVTRAGKSLRLSVTIAGVRTMARCGARTSSCA